MSSAAQGDGVHGQSDLREAIRQYEILLETALSQLPTPKQQDDANEVLARMKAADRALSSLSATASASAARRPTPPETRSDTCSGVGLDRSSPRQAQLQTERFLGEVSDVRFFNLVKHVIQSHLGSVDAKQGIDSYEQDGDILSPSVASSRIAHLPSPDRLATFADAYFSTIHHADSSQSFIVFRLLWGVLSRTYIYLPTASYPRLASSPTIAPANTIARPATDGKHHAPPQQSLR